MTSNYVFAANKAGMETIDRAKIDSIIFDLTSNSFYCMAWTQVCEISFCLLHRNLYELR